MTPPRRYPGVVNFWRSESCQGLAPPPDVTVSSLKWCIFEADCGTCQIQGTKMKGGVWEGEEAFLDGERLGLSLGVKGSVCCVRPGVADGCENPEGSEGCRARLCLSTPWCCPAWFCPGHRSCPLTRLLCCGCNNVQGLAHDAKIGVGCSTEVEVS